MTKTKLDWQRERAERANQLIIIIATHGRRFFYNKKTGLYAHVEIDENRRVWWTDEHSEKRIYIQRTQFGSKMAGFTHGGTLRSLAESIRDYILEEKLLSRRHIAEPCSYGDIWGYGEDAEVVRQKAFQLPMFLADKKPS